MRPQRIPNPSMCRGITAEVVRSYDAVVRNPHHHAP